MGPIQEAVEKQIGVCKLRFESGAAKGWDVFKSGEGGQSMELISGSRMADERE
jgi:hypothetical protein